MLKEKCLSQRLRDENKGNTYALCDKCSEGGEYPHDIWFKLKDSSQVEQFK